jgi:hypothetical protein
MDNITPLVAVRVVQTPFALFPEFVHIGPATLSFEKNVEGTSPLIDL